MPIYINKTADFDNIYPPAYPVMGLNKTSSQGTYGMTSTRDYSGTGHQLITSASFDTEAMICTPTGSSANTQIQESPQMTVVVALNIQAATTAGNIFSCLTPQQAPWSGWRLTQSPNGVGRILVGTGKTDVATVSLDIGTITGAWTSFAITVSDTDISFLRANGTAGSKDITGLRSMSSNNLFINGAPSSSALAEGITGKIGCVAVYNTVLSISEMASALNTTRDFMATKGVTLP